MEPPSTESAITASRAVALRDDAGRVGHAGSTVVFLLAMGRRGARRTCSGYSIVISWSPEIGDAVAVRRRSVGWPAMILRCTGKAARALGVRLAAGVPPGEEDWYLNLLWLDRRKCPLLVHAGSLFSILVGDVRVAQLRPLGAWLASKVRGALAEEGLAEDTLGPLDGQRLILASTASRSVLGFMNDVAMHVQYAVEDAGGLVHCDLAALNHKLRQTLHNQDGRYVTALDLIAEHSRPRPAYGTRAHGFRPGIAGGD